MTLIGFRFLRNLRRRRRQSGHRRRML